MRARARQDHPSAEPRRRVRPLRTASATVLALLLLWVAAVPRFGGCCQRSTANESAAIATLKNVHSAQQQLRGSAAVDRDGDSRGEFGYLAELAGAVPLPAGSAGVARPLEPPMLSQAFGRVEGGVVLRSGYRYRMYLPGADGAWIGEADGGGPGPAAVDADGAERAFLLYAWPVAAGSGNRAFLCDQQGAVRATANGAGRYRGPRAPTPGVAGHARAGGAWRTVHDEPDACGDVWVIVN